MSRNERKSPFWRSKSTRQTGRPGAARTAASASCRQTVVVPTPPLLPATAISWPPSAAPADSSPATRSRIVRDHCEAARTLPSSCSSESGSDTTSRSPACIAARSRSGESSAAISTSPTSGKLDAMSRATSSTGTAPSASWRTTTSTSSRRSARATSSASETTSTTCSSSPSPASADALWASSASAIASSRRCWFIAARGACRSSRPSSAARCHPAAAARGGPPGRTTRPP